MENLLKEIARADEFQIGTILEAVLARHAVLYPNWEISTISIEKTGDRNSQLDNTTRLLERMKHRSKT